MIMRNQWFLYKNKYIIEQSDVGIKATKVPLKGQENEGNYISWEKVIEMSLGCPVKEDA